MTEGSGSSQSYDLGAVVGKGWERIHKITVGDPGMNHVYESQCIQSFKHRTFMTFRELKL